MGHILIKPDLWNIDAQSVDPDWQWAWKGLVFAVIPSARWQHDLISGNRGTLLAGGNWKGTTRHGPSLTSTSATTGGAYWAFHDRILTITNNWTVVSWFDPAAAGLADYVKFLCIPYRNGSWSVPFTAMGFGRNGSSSQGSMEFGYDSGNSESISSSNSFIQDTDSLTQYAFTRAGTAGAFWRNAQAWGTGTYTTNTVDWTNKQPVCVLNRSDSSNGDSSQNATPMALLYNRALSPRELKALYVDPYAMFQPPPLQKFFWIGKVPAGGAVTAIKDMISSDGVMPFRR